MAPVTPGIHHVTAIAGDPQRNADFYVGVLGRRMVKKTVNYDDPDTYHFYFGDGEGTPGTNITFFPWGDRGQRGSFGAGQTQWTAYQIPPDAVEYWTDRLADHGVDVTRTERFGDTVLQFEDPDGIALELVASEGHSDAVPWADSPVPEARQLKEFHSVTLVVPEVGPTAEVLTDVLGFEHERTAGDRHRYRSATGGPGSLVDLVETDRSRGRMGVGTVHHVAFKAASDEDLVAFRDAYLDHGLQPSQIRDRKYFRALYAREPGGVLFELSTPGPGFTVDESLDTLGTTLPLPESLEHQREGIEGSLPPFDWPAVQAED